MESKLLEYFLRVAELGSINRAATNLQLSQSALSRHIAALEREMGTHLFTRSQGGVTLTDSGKLLATRARPLLHQFNQLKDQVGEAATGQLAIGIPPSWHHVLTSPFVERIVEQLPGVSLRVHEGVSNMLRDFLFAGLLDLCIAPFASTPAAGYRQTALVREPLVLVADAQAGLNPAEPQPLSALNGLPLVLPGRQNFIRAQLESNLFRRGMTCSIAVETDTLKLCMELASKGIGQTVVPACALYLHSLGDSICWAPVRGMYITWALYENQARSHSPAVREGRRIVFETVATSLKSEEIWLGAEAVSTAVGRTRST
jgi:LysR family nitrogen assimilation transcriptional regulator